MRKRYPGTTQERAHVRVRVAGHWADDLLAEFMGPELWCLCIVGLVLLSTK